jgi:hypothetical protein
MSETSQGSQLSRSCDTRVYYTTLSSYVDSEWRIANDVEGRGKRWKFPRTELFKHRVMRRMWEWRYSCTILTTALDGAKWLSSHSGHFTPGETAPGTHWIGGWVSSGVGFDTAEKRKISFPCRESNPVCPARSLSLYWQPFRLVEGRTPGSI